MSKQVFLNIMYAKQEKTLALFFIARFDSISICTWISLFVFFLSLFCFKLLELCLLAHISVYSGLEPWWQFTLSFLFQQNDCLIFKSLICCEESVSKIGNRDDSLSSPMRELYVGANLPALHFSEMWWKSFFVFHFNEKINGPKIEK